MRQPPCVQLNRLDSRRFAGAEKAIMSKAKPRKRTNRRTQIESLEDRIVMSADPLGGLGGALSHHGLQDDFGQMQQHAPVEAPPALSQHGSLIAHETIPPLGHHNEREADFWIERGSNQLDELDDMLGDLEQSLASAHDTTGLDDVRADYGFTGGGQTVVVIDSGIAYDHYALGGGFGENYRVVGGWDFTGENDNDPYDDGPEGSHGTHVAGIIGSSDSVNEGVAPDVDLVGLRVFDDAGNGFFSWVENALDWVHDNRDSFENPITAVNLSLGTNWNSDTLPLWANLENEFAQLKADGIFIAVSAGNSFSANNANGSTTYDEPGLSYPAASPHVVPVMSSDDSGFFSSFSQRHQRGIAAPGRFIRSTVPDYAGNNNNVTDDFANFSGTSMAAPYVAGSSVIIREAMEFVGMTGITQDTIYDHMRATADTLHDTATDQDYLRLNVGAAIDALMPEDDFGSSLGEAHNLGTVSAGLSTNSLMEVNGVISTLDDSDYFSFTAGSTGTVTFTAMSTTHQLDADWEGVGGEGWTAGDGQSYTIEVVAGQDYTIGLSSADGLGYYELAVSAESTFSFIEWGAVDGQQTREDLTVGSATWYRVEAGSEGFLSVLAEYGGGAVDLQLYDAQMQLIDQGGSANRVDHYAQLGEEFFLRVEGDASDVDFQLTNLVSLAGSTVSVAGTEAADTYTFTAGTEAHAISVNGLIYNFDVTEYDTYNFDGDEGVDTVTLTGTSGDESATLRVGQGTLVGSDFQVSVSAVENINVYSGGGNDMATLHDSAYDDRLTASPESARLSAADNSYANEVFGFSRTYAYATTGYDQAILQDGATDDYFRGTTDFAVLRGLNHEFLNFASGFDRTYAYASTGHDQAHLEDGAGDDYFRATSEFAVLRGNAHEFFNYAEGFDQAYGYASTGTDVAYLEDSAGNDRYSGYSAFSAMRAVDNSYYNSAAQFDRVIASATTGYDMALMYDGATDDYFKATPEAAELYAKNYEFFNRAEGFDRSYAYASAGFDQALLYDGASDDYFRGTADFAVLRGKAYEFFNYAGGFNRTYAYASTGNDTARLEDGASNDYFRGTADFSVLRGQGYEFFNYAQGFDRVEAFATHGGASDIARMDDSAGNDDLDVREEYFEMTGSDYANYANGFEYGEAHFNAGGVNTVDEDASLDYVFSKFGTWTS